MNSVNNAMNCKIVMAEYLTAYKSPYNAQSVIEM
jgi:hypothetical protein